MNSALKPGAILYVTGGSGFLGRRIIADLVREGFRVRALARSETARATVQQHGAEAIDGDLSDPARMRVGMQGCEAVIHSAAKVETWGHWNDFLKNIFQGI